MSETIEVKDDVRHVMTHIIALGTRAVQEGRDRWGIAFMVSRDVWDRLMREVGSSLREERPYRDESDVNTVDAARARLRLYVPWGVTQVEVSDAMPPGRVELWARHVTTVVR